MIFRTGFGRTVQIRLDRSRIYLKGTHVLSVIVCHLHCLSVKTLTGLWGEESEGLTQNPLNSNSATDNVNFFFFLPTTKLREVSDTEVRTH